MSKFRKFKKWIVFTILLGIASCVKAGKKVGEDKEKRERGVGDEVHMCDFRILKGCPGLSADDRWQIIAQDDNASFMQANFSHADSSVISFPLSMTQSASKKAQPICVTVAHFRDSLTESDNGTQDGDMPRVYIGIEQMKGQPLTMLEVEGLPNEWKTDLLDMTVTSPLRLVIPVTHNGTVDAQVAFQFIQINKGVCPR